MSTDHRGLQIYGDQCTRATCHDPPLVTKLRGHLLPQSAMISNPTGLPPPLQAACHGVKCCSPSHPSLIHNLLQHFNLQPHAIETITHIRHHPSWHLQFTTSITNDKMAAMSKVRMRINDIQIYTDGSGYKGNIGAAAIIPKTGTALRFKLGRETRHTIFKGKLVGILLALVLLEASPWADMVLISLDNQEAIQALQGNHAQPSQYLLNKIHSAILRIKHRHHQLRIHLEWVPGHMDVKGNVLADTHAKMASEGNASDLTNLPHLLRKHLPASIAALKAQRKRTILQQWQADWSQSLHFDKMS